MSHMAVLAKADDLLHIMVVPHSHDDTGWQRTVDQYYEEQVRFTYDSVVSELQKSRDRRFIFVEMAYFSRWWEEQTDSTRNVVRSLTQNGQIEFVNGGWCMADYAVNTAADIIDQVTVGHRYIMDKVGVTPRVGWLIDPFGQGTAVPLLMKAFNYDAVVINRIDYRLKDFWKNTTGLQFHWQPSGQNDSLFTHVLDSHYSAPYGFDWEYFGAIGGDDRGNAHNVPIFDRPPSRFQPATLKDRADAYVAIMKQRAAWYRLGSPYQSARALLVPFGDDFKWQNAYIQFRNMDLLMKYINDNVATYGLVVKYSTVSEYLAFMNRSNTDWPIYEGDFFPYLSDPDSYWTGFFTSRPDNKGNQRSAMGLKRNAEVAHSWARAIRGVAQNESSIDDQLLLSRYVTGVITHHDGATGTSQPDVVADWDNRLITSQNISIQVAAETVSSILNPSATLPSPKLTGTLDMNRLIAGEQIAVAIYNSLGWDRPSALVRVENIPVTNLRVLDSTGSPLESQMSFSEPSGAGGNYTLEFAIPLLPALSVTIVFLQRSALAPTPLSWQCLGADESGVIKNEHLVLSFGNSHRLQQLVVDGSTWTVSQDLFLYHSTDGSNAYIFRPNLTEFPTGEQFVATSPGLCLLHGSVVSKAAQMYTSSVMVYYHLAAGNQYFETAVDVVIATEHREMVLRIQTDLQTTDPISHMPVCYTDGNSLMMRKRVLNQTQWTGSDFSNQDRVAGNYYPITSALSVRDVNNSRALTLLCDRAHGGGSLANGQVEIMVARRCAEHDGIPLNDTTRVTPRFRIVPANQMADEPLLRRKLWPEMMSPIVPLFSADDAVTWPWLTDIQALQAPLPENIHLLNFEEVLSTQRTLIRLEHTFAPNEHPRWSQPVQLDLTRLFRDFTVTNVQSLTLSGNQPDHLPVTNNVITLNPLQIRTIEVNLKKN